VRAEGERAVTTSTCAHSSDTLCPACNEQRRDAYMRRHGKQDFPHPDRHPFHSDGSGVTCVRCELPDANRIHTVTASF
jgi:hypothetical protein